MDLGKTFYVLRPKLDSSCNLELTSCSKIIQAVEDTTRKEFAMSTKLVVAILLLSFLMLPLTQVSAGPADQYRQAEVHFEVEREWMVTKVQVVATQRGGSKVMMEHSVVTCPSVQLDPVVPPYIIIPCSTHVHSGEHLVTFEFDWARGAFLKLAWTDGTDGTGGQTIELNWEVVKGRVEVQNKYLTQSAFVTGQVEGI